MDPVYAVLKKGIGIADELELDSTTLVIDEAMYAWAQQMHFQKDSFKDRLVVRLGDFKKTMA